ncbi:DUF6233 domain-containing protein [Streptomyces tuirus]|uniref:DUF6233 domain-containing protein n=1 Tax=Streptomyces tuirus TaxID=68278 RepID=UPI003397A143
MKAAGGTSPGGWRAQLRIGVVHPGHLRRSVTPAPDLERLLTLRCGTRCGWQASTARSPSSSGGKPNENTADASGPPGRIGSSSSVSALDARPSRSTPVTGRAINRDEAHRLLASGLPACPHCQPDMDLRILD